MAKSKTHRKHVACLEAMWDDTITRPLSVRNLFETAAYQWQFQVAHLTCNTQQELEHNLRLLRGRHGYGILYLAFHGEPGRITLPAATLELEELAARMKRGFRRWVVHFGSCSTVRVPKERLAEFVETTGVSMVLGYRANVDWTESAATDLLLLSWLQQYVDLRRMWSGFRRSYGCLVERTGLSAYPP